jgi:TRAP-type mannitol/chloroaromatic compound transport system substrate-binding protein
MRNAIVGIIIGTVVGIVLGVTVVTPRLTHHAPDGGGNAQTAVSDRPPDATMQLPRRLFAQPAVRFKMGSAYAGSTPLVGTLAKRIDSEIWRISDGKIEIEFHEPNALVPVEDMLDAVASSAIDAAFTSPGRWGDRIPALQLYGAVPFGPAAAEYLAWIYFGGGLELFEEILHQHGVHGIICGVAAAEASGWFRNEVKELDDLKGLRMAIKGLGAKVMAKLGVETRDLTRGAIFAALEAGEIDAVAYSMPAIDLPLGFQEYLKNYYLPGWHHPSTLLELMINRDKWEGLDSTQKAQIKAMCADNIRYGLAESEAAQFAALKELYGSGVELHRWPPEIEDALKQAWRDVVNEEAGADAEFRRVWRSLKTFRSEYAIWNELSQP